MLFRTLIVICKALHALMFHQNAGMLFADSPSEFFWDEGMLVATQTLPTRDKVDAADEAPL